MGVPSALWRGDAPMRPRSSAIATERMRLASAIGRGCSTGVLIRDGGDPGNRVTTKYRRQITTGAKVSLRPLRSRAPRPVELTPAMIGHHDGGRANVHGTLCVRNAHDALETELLAPFFADMDADVPHPLPTTFPVEPH